ncbi:unnamed protein product [Trichobilharzia regenti]|nr:unnamed protein product [Trichobilharzia regenti]
MLDRVSQTTPQFVQEKRVTVSESSFDSTSLQGITSQSKSIKPLRICEDEPESITVVIKEFENGEVDQIDGGEVNISDSGHDSADLSWFDHDEMRGMPTTSEFNKDPVQLGHEVELKADALVEVLDTGETISVNDQRLAPLSTDVNAKLKLIIKDSNGGNPAVRVRSWHSG